MTNYRICRINRTGYAAAFDRLYGDDPGLKDLPSDQQRRAFFELHLVYGDSFSRAMEALGNESLEILCNAEHIQKKWAQEHDVSYTETGWVQEIVRAQIAAFAPDVVYIQGISTDAQGFLPEGDFRQAFPGVKLVVAYSGFPHDMDRFGGVDLVLSCTPEIAGYYQDRGLNSPLVYHGFDEGIADALAQRHTGEAPDREDFDFVFTGLSGVGFRGGHKGRYWDLVRLILETGLKAWVYDGLERIDTEGVSPEDAANLGAMMLNGAQAATPAAMIQLLRQIHNDNLGSDSPAIPLTMLFPDRCQDPVFGLDMFDLLGRSKVVFNRHTDAVGVPVFGNIRLFEAAGMGACLLTDFSPGGEALFEPDAEIVTYASIDEAIEKAEYLADHESERATIAAAGAKRVRASHTVRHRCEQIDAMIVDALAGKSPARAAL